MTKKKISKETTEVGTGRAASKISPARKSPSTKKPTSGKASTKKAAGRHPKSNPVKLSRKDHGDLKSAVTLLTKPGLAVQMTNIIGIPIEKGVKRLPEKVSKSIVKVTDSALRASLHFALLTMENERGLKANKVVHKLLATLCGGVGGLLGLPALAAELPISTTIMLRSIADIARAEGEDIGSVEARLECLTVFALGGAQKSDDGSETGYYATRAALGDAVFGAAKFISKHGIGKDGAPAIVSLITKIATRFSIPVTEKFVAQGIPVIGAAGGAAINLVFINHFQNMAQGHFTLRRLSRKYGAEVIQLEYDRISKGSKS